MEVLCFQIPDPLHHPKVAATEVQVTEQRTQESVKWFTKVNIHAAQTGQTSCFLSSSILMRKNQLFNIWISTLLLLASMVDSHTVSKANTYPPTVFYITPPSGKQLKSHLEIVFKHQVFIDIYSIEGRIWKLGFWQKGYRTRFLGIRGEKRKNNQQS